MWLSFILSAGLGIGGICFLTVPSLAQETGAHLATQALEACHQGRLAVDRVTRLEQFQRGQRLGEQAVAAEETNADTHFALFCNLGELLRLDGETITSLFGLRRMMSELDRALELNPHHIDALSAKGTLLVKLPSLLGGNSEKGEHMLQHVVTTAPKAVNARLALAKVRCQRGQHEEAMRLASDALALAKKQNRIEFIPEAETLLKAAQANVSKTKEHRS